MGKFNDLTGQVFDRLTVINRAPNRNNKTFWYCRCQCGNEIEVRSDQLKSGRTKSCGCYSKDILRQQGSNNFKDLTNQKFGKLTALYPTKDETETRYYWICQCECGNLIRVRGSSLSSGNTQSCGCVKSIGEANIKLLLQNNNFNFISQYHIIVNNKNYFYDFAIIDNNKNVLKLIEFDGIQHFGRVSGWFTEERKKALEQSDIIKNNYALQNNIPLYRIPYKYRDKITLELLTDEKFRVKEVSADVEYTSEGT